MQKGYSKLGEFETNLVGVSSGYFSRIKNSPDVFPSMEILFKLTGIFGVSLDLLLKYDMEIIGGNSQTLLDFVEKLKSDTLKNHLDWRMCSNEYPLCNPEIARKGKFEYHAFVNGGYFATSYDGCTRICLQPLIFSKSEKISEGDRCDGFLLELRNSADEKKQICYTDNINDALRLSIYELSRIIWKKMDDLFVDQETLAVIKKILSDN